MKGVSNSKWFHICTFLAPPTDRKELFKLYQQKMKGVRASGVNSKLKAPKSTLLKQINVCSLLNIFHSQFLLFQIHLGGMIFDSSLQKGVKKRYIPPPMIFTFSSDATHKDVIQK